MAEERTSFDHRSERLTLLNSRSGLPPQIESPDHGASDDKDNVEDWIKGVRALKEKRRIEDEARNRQLEEDILRERKARQERRATRGRSISPSKEFSSAASPRPSTLPNSPISHSSPTLRSTPSTLLAKPTVDQRESSPLLQQMSAGPERTSAQSSEQLITPVPEESRSSTQNIDASIENKVLKRRQLTPEKGSTPRKAEQTKPVHIRSEIPQGASALPTKLNKMGSVSQPVTQREDTLSSIRQGLRSTNTVRAQIPNKVKDNLLSAKSSLRSPGLAQKPEAAGSERTEMLDRISSKSMSNLEKVLANPQRSAPADESLPRNSKVAPKTSPRPSAGSDFASSLAGMLLRKGCPQVSPKIATPESFVAHANPIDTEPERLRHMTKERARRPRKQSAVTKGDPIGAKDTSKEKKYAETQDELPSTVTPEPARRPVPSAEPDVHRSDDFSQLKPLETDLLNLRIDRDSQKPKPPALQVASSSDQGAPKTSVSQRISLRSPIAARAASPFSKLPDRNKTVSKSISSMTGIADLIRERADSTSTSHPPSPALKPEAVANGGIGVTAWKLSKAGGAQVAMDNVWKLLYADETMLFQSGQGDSWYKWVGVESKSNIEEQLTKICGPSANTIEVFQGQEPAKFVELLGGVICTNVSAKNPSSTISPALYCIRKYMDGFAVDQVSCEAVSLCSGFVFLLVSSGSPVTIWVGNGSFPPELDMAKTAASKLAPGKAVVVLQEGSEEKSFWDSIRGPARYASSSYWRLKRDFASYRVDMWSVEGNGNVLQQPGLSFRNSVPEKVHIFDCFFEIYVCLSHYNKKADIVIALEWVKNFARTNASSRPFLPTALVLCPGSKLPRDMKAVFRAPVQEGQELKILELDSAEVLLKRSRFRYHELKNATAIGYDINKLDCSIDLQDFKETLGIDQQDFERLSALEQSRVRRNAAAKLLGN